MVVAMGLAGTAREQLADGLYIQLLRRSVEEARHGHFPDRCTFRAGFVMAGRFRRVLVGWDGSPDAAEALSAAIAVAGTGGHVVALRVVRPRPYAEGSDGGGEDRLGIRSRAEKTFERLREQDPSARGVRMSVQIVESNENKTGPAICAYAAEYAFDLLVLGRHGEGGIIRTRLGRVAETAAHSSKVPVLLLAAP